MAKVAIIGIPLGNLVIEDGTPMGLIFKKGATDRLRWDLKEILEKNPDIEVSESLELITQKGDVSYEAFMQLGAEAKCVIADSKADVTLVIGADHAASLPFYHIEGHVVRADAHGDAYVLNGNGSSRFMIRGGTYMYFVEKNGLKAPEEVWNVGIAPGMLGEQYYRGGLIGKSVSIKDIIRIARRRAITFLDIDVDVLSESYGLPHGHSTSYFEASDIANLITKLEPEIVGVFECDGKFGHMPESIVSGHQDVFGPICEAVAQTAVARSLKSREAFADSYR